MIRNHNLAKAISDCGWGMFCTMFKYKADSEGKTYGSVDRFFPSSKTCNVCLNQIGSLPFDVIPIFFSSDTSPVLGKRGRGKGKSSRLFPFPFNL
jgi:transposase